MDGDIKQSTVNLTIGSLIRTYYLWRTNAPAAYDYDYTLHVMGDTTPAAPGYENDRLVLIPAAPAESPHAQVIRYRSGLYAAAPSDLLSDKGQGGLEEILWKAIHTLHKGND